jgi:hypothetical protein
MKCMNKSPPQERQASTLFLRIRRDVPVSFCRILNLPSFLGECFLEKRNIFSIAHIEISSAFL